jgi:ABC-type siderophore export system fused ATPase/permease subunit
MLIVTNLAYTNLLGERAFMMMMMNMIITFIILFIACWRRGFDPGNQLPKAECKLYARSSPIITPARNINQY